MRRDVHRDMQWPRKHFIHWFFADDPDKQKYREKRNETMRKTIDTMNISGNDPQYRRLDAHDLRAIEPAHPNKIRKK